MGFILSKIVRLKWTVAVLILASAPFVFTYAANNQQSNVTKKAAQTNTSKKTVQSKTAKQNTDKINKLKQEKKSFDRQTKKIDNKLTDTKRTTRKTLHEIDRLSANIEQRNYLIQKQGKEIDDLAAHIDSLNNEILNLEMKYNVAKRKYVDLVYHAYQKNTVYDRLMFVFSAKDIQESWNRFEYVGRFAVLRREQAAHIKTTKEDLQSKKEEQEQAKSQSEKLLAERESEKKKLEADKKEQKELVASLRKQTSELKKELAERRRKSAELDNRIQALVNEELLRIQRENSKNGNSKKTVASNKKSDKSATNSNKDKNKNTASVNEKESSSFSQCKGHLHWPVQQGFISGHFGAQQSKYDANSMDVNKGVLITSTGGTTAISVFEGQVSSIFAIPGNNTAVIVRHGLYFTVYANLAEVYVKKGQTIKRGDRIGRMYAESGENPGVFFMIYKGRYVQNPESWLRPI